MRTTTKKTTKGKTWTVDAMLAERPCAGYDRDRITALWAGHARLTLAEILVLDIPAADRLWVAWRPSALTRAQRQAAVTRIVTRAVERYALGSVIDDWARGWLSGGDRTARAAAARAAAARAARAAAWAARAAEARAEAAAAAAWAARAAAWAARAAEAAEAEQVAQIADVLTVLDEGEGAGR